MIDTNILNDLKSLKKEFNNGFDDLKQDLAETLLEDIQDLTPVDTGKLKNSYKIKSSKNGMEVVSDCEYAPYVDNGHSTKGGSFIKGKHMYDKSILKLEEKANMKVNKFLDKINSF